MLVQYLAINNNNDNSDDNLDANDDDDISDDNNNDDDDNKDEGNIDAGKDANYEDWTISKNHDGNNEQQPR